MEFGLAYAVLQLSDSISIPSVQLSASAVRTGFVSFMATIPNVYKAIRTLFFWGQKPNQENLQSAETYCILS